MSRTAPHPIAAVVFDCDGLLLDTEPRWTVAERAVFALHGREFTHEHKVAMIGTSSGEAAAYMERVLELPGCAPQLAAELLDRAASELACSDPLPGAVELADGLRGNVPIAVASNTARRLLLPALRSGGLEDRFDRIVSADDVPLPKPAPDIYLEACRLLGAEPGRSIAFEDSVTGTTAARAAGMFVVGVPSVDGIDLDADLVVPSLADPRVLALLGPVLRRPLSAPGTPAG